MNSRLFDVFIKALVSGELVICEPFAVHLKTSAYLPLWLEKGTSENVWHAGSKLRKKTYKNKNVTKKFLESEGQDCF